MLNKAVFISAAFVLFVSYFLFTAQASTDASLIPNRGESSGRISGYEISDLHFLWGEDPSYLGAVEFKLDSEANQVLIAFNSGEEETFTCLERTERNTWHCKVEIVKVGAIQELTVYAVSH